MIEGMGIQWAGTFLGLLSAIMVPIPIIFYLKGGKIREKSHFAPTFPHAAGASAHAHDTTGSDSDLEKGNDTEAAKGTEKGGPKSD